MYKHSLPYKSLCAEFYELDKPFAPKEGLQVYLRYAQEANGSILEPMCGTGRYLIPLLEMNYAITGFDQSSAMLDICRQKCLERGLMAPVVEATFESFTGSELYDLIMIPSGSFGLLTNSEDTKQSLKFISSYLKPGGRFVFDLETLMAVGEPQGSWMGKWANKPDGSKIILNTLLSFDANTRIETVLCRYELWEGNKISHTEVEDFQLRLYEPAEIELLLEQHGLRITGKWKSETSEQVKATDTDPAILYECMKD